MKKRVLRMLLLLEQSNDEFLGNQLPGAALELLAACQDTALSIGNYLESQELDFSAAVEALESYCESVYQMSLALEDEQKRRALADGIRRQLASIRSMLQALPSEKVKIVFLPYKAAMWDCFESVWEAAVQDERCEVSVVPIPYFDRGPDGTMGQMQYDGWKFPPHVPVISWETFQLSAVQPDVIYIHNPYDNTNHATSVHPDFYSEELKKHTDLLVYIPYFYTDYTLPQSHIDLPAYRRADIIVAQNKPAKKQLAEAGVPREKIKPLGSPKLDRLLNYEAKRIIPKCLEEAAGKKVVLLNTSINGILQGNESLLDKLEEIFAIFQGRRDYLLVWRPHPLFETTLRSIRPTLYQRYLAIKKRFVEAGFGIFDSGMDLDQVVAGADIYMGEDTSSIVSLFASLGKPVFLLDPQLTGIVRREAFFDFYQDGGRVVFVNSELSAVCIGDAETGVIDTVIPIDDKEFVIQRGYTDVVKYGEELYFTPMAAKKLLQLNLRTNTLRSHALAHPAQFNFNRAFRYKNSIYFVPTMYGAVLRYDCERHELTEYQQPVRELKKRRRTDGFHSMFASCVADDTLFIATPTSNCVVAFNLETQAVASFEVGAGNSGYWDMIFDGQDLWLNPFKGTAIVRWKPFSGQATEYRAYPQGFRIPDSGQDLFIRLIDCGESILAFPKCANMIVELDKASGEMREYKLPLPYHEGTRKDKFHDWGSHYYFAKRVGDYIYALSAYDNTLLKIDHARRAVETTSFRFSDEAKKLIANPIFAQTSSYSGSYTPDYFFHETTICSIPAFLDAAAAGGIGVNPREQAAFLRRLANKDGSAGRKIHEAVMKESQV